MSVCLGLERDRNLEIYTCFSAFVKKITKIVPDIVILDLRLNDNLIPTKIKIPERV